MFIPPDFETSLERIAQILSQRRSPPPAAPSEPDASLTSPILQTPEIETPSSQSEEDPTTSD